MQTLREAMTKNLKKVPHYLTVQETARRMQAEKVEAIMSAPVSSIDIHRTPQDAHDMMADLGVRHLAVTDAGKIVGLLSVRDLLVYFKRVSEPRITQD